MADWIKSLSMTDFYMDGAPLRGKIGAAWWAALDWDKARIDLGPSPAGNVGPYWHVPMKGPVEVDGELYSHGDTVHRLYPRILKTKWAPLILHACEQCLAEKPRKWARP